MLARSENGAANTEGQDYGPAAWRVKPGGAGANRPVSLAPIRTEDGRRPAPLSGRGALDTGGDCCTHLWPWTPHRPRAVASDFR